MGHRDTKHAFYSPEGRKIGQISTSHGDKYMQRYLQSITNTKDRQFYHKIKRYTRNKGKWNEPQITNIDVFNPYQGKGLSKLLYSHAIQHEKRRGYRGLLVGENLKKPWLTLPTYRHFNPKYL